MTVLFPLEVRHLVKASSRASRIASWTTTNAKSALFLNNASSGQHQWEQYLVHMHYHAVLRLDIRASTNTYSH